MKRSLAAKLLFGATTLAGVKFNGVLAISEKAIRSKVHDDVKEDDNEFWERFLGHYVKKKK